MLFGEDTNITSTLNEYYKLFYSGVVDNVTNAALTRITKMESDHNVLTVWNAYKAATSVKAKRTILTSFFENNKIDYSNITVNQMDTMTLKKLVTYLE